MKNYLILTAILTLTACGAGSGGGTFGDKRPSTSNIIPATNFDDENITSMYSTVNNSASRATFILGTNRTDLHNASQTELNAEFLNMKNFLDNTTWTDVNTPEKMAKLNEYFKFLNSSSLTSVGTESDWNEIKTQLQDIYNKYGKLITYDFEDVVFQTNGHPEFQFNVDSDDKITSVSINGTAHTRVGETSTFGNYEFESVGKNFGMRFSDFGRLRDTNQIANSFLYTGGYTANRIENLPESYKNQVFSGGAVGYIETDTGYTTLTGDATLTVDSDNVNKQTLVMDFDNWYTATFIKEGNNVSADYNANGNTIADNAKIEPEGEIPTMDLNFYGDTTPSEFNAKVLHEVGASTVFEAVAGGKVPGQTAPGRQ